jgi:hypothetical protein
MRTWSDLGQTSSSADDGWWLYRVLIRSRATLAKLNARAQIHLK